jgi:hypothetical protein
MTSGCSINSRFAEGIGGMGGADDRRVRPRRAAAGHFQLGASRFNSPTLHRELQPPEG